MKIFLQYKWKVFFGVCFLWLCGIGYFALAAYHSPMPQGSSAPIEALKLILLSLGGLGVLTSTYLSSVGSIEARQAQILENTFDLITKWDDPHLANARKFTRKTKELKPNISDLEFVKSINDNDDLKHSVVLVLNYFDQVRVSLNMKRIDISLFNKSLGIVMADYHYRLRPFVATYGEQHLRDWDQLLEISKR